MTAGRLAGRFIGLGITGSIAAYKAPELVRLLRAEGADVQVLMTPSAARFVAPLALAALSGRAVEDDVLALLSDGRIGHVVVADSADAILVAPATAHWLAAMAAGLAGDAVTATCLATSAPVIVAPAMDGEMYAHPATRANVARLSESFGYVVVPPATGPLASGQVGVGRLAEPVDIVNAVVAAIGDRPIRAADPAARPPAIGLPREADLEGRRLVISAGGTAEPIDPVRFLGNRSTGKMGVAIAEAALERGATVTLVVGHVTVALPANAAVVEAETTEAMRGAVISALEGSAAGGGADALIMAAAVADFRPISTAKKKLPRSEGLHLELEPTPDILAEVGRLVREGRLPADARTGRRPILVGFAAETGSLDAAPEKLRRKGLDLLVANDVDEPGSGFGTETNRVTVYGADGTVESWPLLVKGEVAELLLDRVVALLDASDIAAHTGTRQRIEPEINA